MTGDCNRITDKTVAFLTSKSGDTAETVKAANWLKEQGVRLFAAVGKENSTLESICDDTIVYGEGRPQELGLPTAPKQFLHYFEEPDRPQASLDRDLEGGMAVTIGRLRPDTQYDYKFVSLSHNTLRGAAGGAVLLAELLCAEGYMDR